MDIQQQLSRFLAPLKTRVYNMVVRGVIKIVNDATKVQQMQNTLLAGEVKDGLECYQWYGFTSVPLPGMETAVVFCGGDRSNGIIIGVGDRQFRLKDLKGGEVALYTDEGDYLKFAREHNIEMKTTNLKITADTSVALTSPTVTMSGDLNVSGTVTAGTDVKTNNISLKLHPHSGVTAGGANTGSPVAS